MDNAATASELNRIPSATAVAAQRPAQDDLAFFRALWLWIPVALVLWSLIIWGVTRLV